jgi:hypothetical protein
MITLANLNPYGSLTATELTVMGALEKLIRANTPKKIQKVVDAFKNYSLPTQAKLIHHSPSIREFCQTNLAVQPVIAAKLKEFNSPNIEIISKNKLESHSILDHVFAYHLLDAFVRIKRDDISGHSRVNILKDACSIGSYHGLIIRCKFNLAVLNNQTIASTPEKKAATLKKIFLDCDHLTNFYGAIGYIRKGIVLLELAHYYHAQNETDRVTDAREQATKNFMCASLLQDDSYSNALIDSITKGAGIASIFTDTENEFQLGDWLAAQILFQDSVGKDTYNMLEEQAKTEIQPDLTRAESAPQKPAEESLRRTP